jgi:hypothetical protein
MLPGRAERGVSWSNTSRCHGNLSGGGEKNRGEKRSFGIRLFWTHHRTVGLAFSSTPIHIPVLTVIETAVFVC